MPPLAPRPMAQHPRHHHRRHGTWWHRVCQRATRNKLRFFLKQHVTILDWLPKYALRRDLRFDVVAGVTVGMMIVAEEISLSTMMDVPPMYGLYTAAVVPLIYAMFGTSRALSVANGAEVSLLVGSAVNKIPDVDERVATAILLSFLSGLLLLCMGVFRLGLLADFFSRPVIGGFVSAGGVLIMLSQCANWLGVSIASRDLPFLTVLDLIEESPHVNMKSFCVGLMSILVLLGMRLLKRRATLEIAKVQDALMDEYRLESTRSMQSQLEDDVDLQLDLEDPENTCQEEVEEAEAEADREATNHESEKADDHTVNDQATRASRPKDAERVGANGATTLSPRKKSCSSAKRNTPGAAVAKSPAARSVLEEAPLSSRHPDLPFLLNSARHRKTNDVLLDDSVGFSLSDQDFMQIEQPLSYDMSSWNQFGRDSTPVALRSNKAGMLPPRSRFHFPTPKSNVQSMGSPKQKGPLAENHPRQDYPMGHNMASPAKSIMSESSESTCSTSALNGRGSFQSFLVIRMLRSKLAVLATLRLVCDLGPCMVCLLGGILGYLAGEDELILTGPVRGGFPSPIFPWYGLSKGIVEPDRLYHLIIDTLSISIITYMSSIAISKRMAIKEGYRIRPNQELVALGFSNLIGSFFGSMPSTGGMSRTAVNMQNARTQLASLITVGVVVLVLYTATGALQFLPKATLSAIIIVAGYSLIETNEARWLYSVKRDEFYIWLVSFVLTVMFGVLPGLLSSMFCSLAAVIYKTRQPSVTMLGEIVDQENGGTRLVDLELYPEEAKPLSDIVVIRVESALYFANCEYLERVIEREISKREETEEVAVCGVVIDASSIMDWDSTTIQMMKSLQEALRMRAIQLAIVNAREKLHNLLVFTEFVNGIVRNDASITVYEAIDAIRDNTRPKRSPIQLPSDDSGPDEKDD